MIITLKEFSFTELFFTFDNSIYHPMAQRHGSGALPTQSTGSSFRKRSIFYAASLVSVWIKRSSSPWPALKVSCMKTPVMHFGCFFPQRLGFRQALVSSDWIDPIAVAPLAWLRCR